MKTQMFEPFTFEPIRFIGSEGETLFDFSLEDVGLTVENLKQMYYYMVLVRRFDDKGMILTRSGKAAFYVEAKGQEAAQVASAWAFEKKDCIIPATGFILSGGTLWKRCLPSLWEEVWIQTREDRCRRIGERGS